MKTTQSYGLYCPDIWDRAGRGTQADNLQKLDGALSGLDRRAEGLQGSLEALGHNLYGLTLQSYYDGKHTGYTRGLLFDGFADGSGVASLTTGLTRDAAGRRLLLDAVGQRDVSMPGVSGAIQLGARQTMGTDWTATGNGTLTRVALNLAGIGTLEFYQGNTLLGSGSFSLPNGGGVVEVRLSVAVSAGVTYTLKVTNTNNTTMSLSQNASRPGVFCYAMTFTPRAATSGTMTAVSRQTGGSFQRALAWVRHTGGTISLTLGDKAMSRTGSRSTTDPGGVPCVEAAFALNSPLSGAVQVKLGLSTSAGTNVRVYDYGVMLL